MTLSGRTTAREAVPLFCPLRLGSGLPGLLLPSPSSPKVGATLLRCRPSGDNETLVRERAHEPPNRDPSNIHSTVRLNANEPHLNPEILPHPPTRAATSPPLAPHEHPCYHTPMANDLPIYRPLPDTGAESPNKRVTFCHIPVPSCRFPVTFSRFRVNPLSPGP